MAQNPRITEQDCHSNADTSARLTRRSYVRSLAAAATVATSGALVGTAAADDGYDVITVSSGEDRTIHVEDGETFENVLIDCTAPNARVTIAAHATDWTIRNVAVHGELDVGRPATVFGISDREGGTSTFENVYLGDGSTNAGNATAETGIWVSPEHSGHIDMRHVNVQGFPDNGVYASAPGGGAGGTIHIDECFAANNYVANFRIGSEGSKVTNSSVLVDGDGYDGRGIWVWAPGPCEIENCQLELNGANFSIDAGAASGGSTAVVSATEYDTGFNGGIGESHGATAQLDGDCGTAPSAEIPDGVPTSAEAAASGDH
ncbi:hypothetical protein [Natronobiforma cellulositropha]|uniref:hypothetical protein n=1 Tax=Natronobiforma cellulositropha TaxID=1679076 RepID=UPI0021D59FF6|nr:hypothetical protein [Natronobiforma cellulositropha]